MNMTLQEMEANAERASAFLKSIAHSRRLMILCYLSHGDYCVGELEQLLHLRQATVSQMLARLREDGLVKARREGKTIYYTLADTTMVDFIELLSQKFCDQKGIVSTHQKQSKREPEQMMG